MKIFRNNPKEFQQLENIPDGIVAYLINDPDEKLPLASIYAKMEKGTVISSPLASSFEIIIVKTGQLEVTSSEGVKILESGSIAYFPSTGKKDDKVTYKALKDSETISFEAEV